MGKKSAPAAPDYAAAAEKTAAGNAQAQTVADWANRPNQNTPWGSQSWESKAEIDPSTGKPITSWTQNTTLNPQSQAALDSQMRVDTGKSQLAEASIGRMNESFSQPFDWGSMPSRATTPQAPGMMSGFQNQGPGMAGGFTNQGPGMAGGFTNQGPGMQGQISQDGVNPLQSSFGQTNVQGQIDRSNLPGMGQSLYGGIGDDTRQRFEKGLMDRLAPEQDRQRERLDLKLRNQGITMGSEAYKGAQQAQGDQFSRDQYNALMQGGQEQLNQFNMAQNAGQYANAQNQQQFNQNQAAGNFANQAAGQQFGQNQALAQFGNQAAGQQFGQNQAMGQFQNAANQQGYNQARGGAEFQNAANQQGYNQALGGAQFQNQANQQGYNQGLGGAEFYNQASSRNFDQGMQAANFQNQNRQQAIAEQQLQRALPLNEMNAILSGAQVGMPQMPGFNTSRSSGGADYSGAARDQYQGAMDQYNSQQQGQQGMMSGIGGLASMGMMAF